MFAATMGGLPFPLVSDYHPIGEVAKAYGVWNEGQGRAFRACFIIDKDGVMRWKKVYERGIPDTNELLAELAKLPT